MVCHFLRLYVLDSRYHVLPARSLLMLLSGRLLTSIYRDLGEGGGAGRDDF